MWRPSLPFARDDFITPMAAVAGAVADEVLRRHDWPAATSPAPTSTTAATSRSTRPRAESLPHRPASTARTGHRCSPTARRSPARDPRARHRDQRLARPQLLARHRRRRHRAGRDRGRGRRRRDDHRQRRRPARPSRRSRRVPAARPRSPTAISATGWSRAASARLPRAEIAHGACTPASPRPKRCAGAG